MAKTSIVYWKKTEMGCWQIVEGATLPWIVKFRPTDDREWRDCAFYHSATSAAIAVRDGLPGNREWHPPDRDYASFELSEWSYVTADLQSADETIDALLVSRYGRKKAGAGTSENRDQLTSFEAAPGRA